MPFGVNACIEGQIRQRAEAVRFLKNIFKMRFQPPPNPARTTAIKSHGLKYPRC